MPAIALSARNLTKVIGDRTIVDDVSFDVNAGEVFGFLGPNGAGKTTTIRMLVGLIKPTEGTVEVCGFDIRREFEEAMRCIGCIVETPDLYRFMTGRENLEHFARMLNVRNGDIERVSSLVGMSHRLDQRVGTYSLGMRQRLGIAQALLHEPDVVFLDEPVSSLDPEGRRDVLDLIAALRGETTVILSTHVLSDVERVCDRVAILDRGRLVTEAPLAGLLAEHARPIYRLTPEPGQEATVNRLVERLRASAWAIDVTVEPGGIVRVTVGDQDAAGRAILPLVVEIGVRLAAFERGRPTLEDVFLELVGPRAADDLDGRGFVRPREVER